MINEASNHEDFLEPINMHHQLRGEDVPTSQKAPLESILARMRSRKIMAYVQGKKVLDFGCGVQAWNARTIAGDCTFIAGVDRSLPRSSLILDGIPLFRELHDLPVQNFDVIVALAVFEHIRPLMLRPLLEQLRRYTLPRAIIVGTVPTPRSRRLLEFLSYQLRLIDRSQIEDHKLYYDDLWLSEITSDTGWSLKKYERFLFGMNSLFVLART